MSKSLGNVIDPIDMIEGITLEKLHEGLLKGNLRDEEVIKAMAGQKEDFPNGIPECGTDALRFSLCDYTGQGKDINLDVKRVESTRTFCNKIWQAFRLSQSLWGPGYEAPADAALPANAAFADRYLLARLNAVCKIASESWGNYDLSAVTSALHSWWIYDLCDVYLEAVKVAIRHGTPERQAAAKATLFLAIEEGLRLLAPFMPFLTEELWQRLPRRPSDPETIHLARYPAVRAEREDAALEADFNRLKTLLTQVRSLSATYGVALRHAQPNLSLVGRDEATSAMLTRARDTVAALLGLPLEKIDVIDGDKSASLRGCAAAIVDGTLSAQLHIAAHVDAAKEAQKLKAKIGNLNKQRGDLANRMNLPDYGRVPEAVQTADKEKLGRFEEELKASNSALSTFEDILAGK